MKLGWLHDSKNALKWHWIHEVCSRELRPGYHMYLTDASSTDRPSVFIDRQIHRALTENYERALRAALDVLSSAGVTAHFAKPVPSMHLRSAWTDDALRTFAGTADRILLDPDTGIALGERAGAGHALVAEVVRFANAFVQVDVFQHRSRQSFDDQSAAIRDALRGDGCAAEFTGPEHDMFLVSVTTQSA